jgi:hypothetical protein
MLPTLSSFSEFFTVYVPYICMGNNYVFSIMLHIGLNTLCHIVLVISHQHTNAGNNRENHLHLASQGLCPPYFRGICQKSIRPNNRFVPHSRKPFERIVDCLCYNHFCLCAMLSLHLISFVTRILIFLIKSNY